MLEILALVERDLLDLVAFLIFSVVLVSTTCCGFGVSVARAMPLS